MHNFMLAYDEFIPCQEGLREAFTSTGNGYFCTRGAAEWQDSDDIHYAGTYAHGAYNRETTILGGRPVLNEDLVNLPNWLSWSCASRVRRRSRSATSSWSATATTTTSATHLVAARCASAIELDGKATLRSRRFVSMAHVHQAGDRVDADRRELVGRRWRWCRRSTGASTNANVARYGQLEGRHLDPVSP